MLSPTFGFVFVSVAALAASGLAALGVPFLLQLAGFSVVLLACLYFVRPHFAHKLEAQGVPTRTQALVGQIGRVTVAIDPTAGSGRIEVAGQDWAARSASPIPAGTAVRIDGADGIVLHVVPLEPAETPDA